MKNILLIILCFFTVPFLSQSQWHWAVTPDAVNQSYSAVNDMAYDNTGNILITGYFTTSLAVTGSTLQVSGNNDCFIASINKNSDLNWINAIGGPFLNTGTGICSDNIGNNYTVGSFDKTFTVNA